MPKVAAAVKVIGAWLGGKSVGAFIAKTVIYAAVSYGIGKLMAKGASVERGSKIEPERNTAAPRKFIFGQTRIGGIIGYYSTSGDENKYFHLIVLLAGHELESIETVYFGDETVTLDGSGMVTSANYKDKARVKFAAGTDTQAVFTDLVTDTVSNTLGRWIQSGSSFYDALRGIGAVYIRLEYDTEVFAAGIPAFSVVAKGVKAYDPRLDTTEGGSGSHRKDDASTWEYSANPALCLAWYLTYPIERGGYGLSWDKIDLAALEEAADVCDEDVSGSPRYTVNGVVDTSMTPAQIISTIKTAMAGDIIWPEGICTILAGEYRTPTVTLDEDDLINDISITTTRPITDAYNQVTGTYIEPGARYAMVDMGPVWGINWRVVSSIDTATNRITTTAGHDLSDNNRVRIYATGGPTQALPGGISGGVWYYARVVSSTVLELSLTKDGAAINITSAGSGTYHVDHDVYLSQDGLRKIRDIEFDMVTSAVQAQRLANIELRRNREALAVRMTTSLAGLQLLPGDTVKVLNNRFGWWTVIASTNQNFTVTTATNKLNVTAHGLNDDDPVVLSSSGTLPAGLAEDTKYYVRDSATNDFRLCLRRDGPAVAITNTGTGTHRLDQIEGKVFELNRIRMVQDGDPPTPVVGLEMVATSESVWTASAWFADPGDRSDINRGEQGWPAPTLELDSNYDDVGPSSQDTITYTLPDAFKFQSHLVQVWDNFYSQGSVVNQVIYGAIPAVGGTDTIPVNNYVSSIAPGETSPLIACRYEALGIWSKWAIINYTIPTVSGIYNWTS